MVYLIILNRKPKFLTMTKIACTFRILMLPVFIFVISIAALSQTPKCFSYQTVVRNNDGSLVIDKQVGIQISILQNGTPVCVEFFTPITNSFGLVSLEIGSKDPAAFSAIDWSTGTFTIKISIDPDGGTNYAEMGTSPLLSVPFAQHSETAGNVFSGQYTDLEGKPDLSKYLTSEVDGDTTNEIELPVNATAGDMCYYDGSQWNRIEKPTNPDFRYSLEWDFNNNKPYWKAQLPSIVFNGQTLYVYPTDNSTGLPWYNGTYIQTNANSPTDGEVNTVIIVTSQGEGSYAARICADLVAYGYDDWYLPSKDELNALYQNKNEIMGFSNTYYWSSTEYNETDAWGEDFTNGSQVSYAKYPTSRVRCVRK